MVKQKDKGKCKTCYGFGLWAIGDASPMGPMDAADGMGTIPCPECGASANPIKRKKNVWTTVNGEVIPVKKLSDEHLKNIVLYLIENDWHNEMIEKEVKRRKIATKKLVEDQRLRRMKNED